MQNKMSVNDASKMQPQQPSQQQQQPSQQQPSQPPSLKARQSIIRTASKRSHRPTVEDVLTHSLTPLAHQYWAPSPSPAVTVTTTRVFDPQVIERVYQQELLAHQFEASRITILEFSQYLEK